MENEKAQKSLETKLQEVRKYVEGFTSENESDFCSLVGTPDEIILRLQNMIEKREPLCKFIFACGNQEAYTLQYSVKKDEFKICAYYILHSDPEIIKTF